MGELEEVTLPTNINGNSYDLYYFTGAKKVIIPNTFTTINSYAFCNSNVQSVILSIFMKMFAEEGGMLYDVPMAVLGLLHDFKRLSESFFHTFLCQWVVLVSNGIVGILDSIYVSEGF